MSEPLKLQNWLLAIVGAIVGGVVGFFIFVWLIRHGLYAMILPGGFVGLLGGVSLRGRSQAFGVVCGILAIMLGVFAEWWTAPFIDDRSFGYFLAHLHQLKPVTLIMISLGGLCGYWLGQGQSRTGE